MKIENAAALSFIMQDDIYLVGNDKLFYRDYVAPAPVAEAPDVETLGIAVTPITATPLAEPPAVDFKYSGGNKKNFLIVVHYHELEFIDEKHLTAIENILKRLGLGLDDTAIFNRAKHNAATFQQLTTFFSPQKMLVLGNAALPHGIAPLELNKPKQLNNCNTLFSFSFDEMMDNNDYKKAFWEQMKLL